MTRRYSIRNWLIRKLAGKPAVVMNAEVRGMLVLRGPHCLVESVDVDNRPVVDGDPYAWFTPSRVQPFGVRLIGGDLTATDLRVTS